MSARDLSDRALVRRAALSVAWQTAVAVALVVVVVAVVAFALNSRDESRRARDAVQAAATSADDVTDPPAGILLLEYQTGKSPEFTAGTPSAVRDLSLSTAHSGMRTVRAGSVTYQGFVGRIDDGRRFVALTSMAPAEQERRRLLDALLFAGIVGVAGSAVVGGLIGRRAAQPLGAALALQRRFVADASHELRTPLTILHTRAQLLQRRAARAGEAALAEQSDDLVADTRALGEVVEDLLLAAQLQAAPDRSDRVDLAAVVREVVRSFQDHAQEAGVELTLTGSAGPLWVDGVRPALRRAVSNLIDNAVAHAGGRVTVTLGRDRDSVTVQVDDDGSGLDPAHADELMRRFVRGSDDSGTGRRFGLGLALVREVVTAHRGRIDIDGEPGVGARFTLSFPAAP